MVLYAFCDVFVDSRFAKNPLIRSWETNTSFLRWFCHTPPPIARSLTNLHHPPDHLHVLPASPRGSWSVRVSVVVAAGGWES
jgi:hypothetical protein